MADYMDYDLDAANIAAAQVHDVSPAWLMSLAVTAGRRHGVVDFSVWRERPGNAWHVPEDVGKQLSSCVTFLA